MKKNTDRKKGNLKEITLDEEAIEELRNDPQGKEIVKYAKRFLRCKGTNKVTWITLGQTDRVLSLTRPGYRYEGTGRYVSSGCRHYRGVYYQRALVHLELEAFESGFGKIARRVLGL